MYFIFMSIDQSLLTPGKIYEKHISESHSREIKIYQPGSIDPEKLDWIILKPKHWTKLLS